MLVGAAMHAERYCQRHVLLREVIIKFGGTLGQLLWKRLPAGQGYLRTVIWAVFWMLLRQHGAALLHAACISLRHALCCVHCLLHC